MRSSRVLVAMFLGVMVLHAQGSDSSGIVFGPASDDVVVLLDGVRIEPQDGDTIRVRSGRHVVEHVVGNRFRWTIHRMADTLDLAKGEMVMARSMAATDHLITTQPEGASVYKDGRLLGKTPYLFRHTDHSEGMITLRMDGYESKSIHPNRSREHVFLVHTSASAPSGGALFKPNAPTLKNEEWTIASAVVMVGSSIAAAYMKDRANKALDEYHRTGSQAALDDVRRYDTYSAVAAATIVVSFSGFALFLTTE